MAKDSTKTFPIYARVTDKKEDIREPRTLLGRELIINSSALLDRL